jgi:uncharacterized protein involved in exopolysaccharide biosynthesis
MYLKYDLTLNDYLKIVKRKFFLVTTFAMVAFILSFFIIVFLPSVYESTATILIESKKIDAVKPNPWDPQQKDNMTARFEALNTVLLTNEKMLAIAKKYHLFEPKTPKVLTSQEEAQVADLVRAGITTKLIKAETGSVYQEKQALAIQISAQFDTADVTYNIAKDIVNAFVNETSKSSKEKAVNVATFFDKEAEVKKKTLESVEQELIAYKKSHAAMLPQNVPLQVGSLERLESDLRTSQKEQAVARSELSKLEVELESAKSGIGLNKKVVNESRFSSYKDEVDKLNADLSKLQTIYSDSHPEIKSLKRKIAALEKLETEESNNQESVTEKSLEVAKVQAQIDAVNRKIHAMEREEAQIRSRMDRTQGLVFQSAQTEGVLEALERKYESAKQEYLDAKEKQDKAKTDKEIELQDQGERFVVTEPPIKPTYPIKPNRKLLLVAALLLSVIGGVVLGVLTEMFDGRIRGADSIAQVIKMQPIAVIPYIKNGSDKINFRYKMLNLLYIGVSTVTVLLVLIHFFITPFDQLIAKFFVKV